MSTNDHHVHPSAPRTGVTGADELEERRQQQRLAELLQRRERMARIVAEREAHDLDDAADYQHELAVVEQSIGHCWPQVWDAQFSEWVTRDAARMHSLKTPRRDCGICITIHRASSPIHEA